MDRMRFSVDVLYFLASCIFKYLHTSRFLPPSFPPSLLPPLQERDEWKGRYEKELLHMQKLRENNRRLERELHGFLQKKYYFMQMQSRSASVSGGSGGGSGGGAG